MRAGVWRDDAVAWVRQGRWGLGAAKLMAALSAWRLARTRATSGALVVAALCSGAIVFLANAGPFAQAAIRFDRQVVAALDQFAGRSPLFDRVVAAASDNNILQGGVIVGLFWWVWFSADDKPAGLRRRQAVVTSLVALYVAVAVALVLRDVLPFRPRPFADPAQFFVLPDGFVSHYTSSSMPSGHAVVFFALAIGLFSISRTLGIIGLAHALLVDALPRMYLGLHYPTDVLAGALLAIAVFEARRFAVPRGALARPFISWSKRHPASFYAVFFLLSLEIATEFGSTRLLIGVLSDRLV